MADKQTQAGQVLAYLREHPEGITTIDAFYYMNITRLAARISDIKKSGIGIVTTREQNGNKRYCRYRLEVQDCTK